MYLHHIHCSMVAPEHHIIRKGYDPRLRPQPCYHMYKITGERIYNATLNFVIYIPGISAFERIFGPDPCVREPRWQHPPHPFLFHRHHCRHHHNLQSQFQGQWLHSSPFPLSRLSRRHRIFEVVPAVKIEIEAGLARSSCSKRLFLYRPSRMEGAGHGGPV